MSFPRLLAFAAAAAATLGFGALAAVRATVEDGSELSLIAIEPYLRQGFILREDHWDGALAVGEARTIRYQLFKEHTYVFCAVPEVRGARLSIRVSDPEGNPVAPDVQQVEDAGRLSALARLRPPSTGAYTFVIRLEQSPARRTGYGVVYCYK